MRHRPVTGVFLWGGSITMPQAQTRNCYILQTILLVTLKFIELLWHSTAHIYTNLYTFMFIMFIYGVDVQRQIASFCNFQKGNITKMS